MPRRVLVAGCGALGGRVAARLAACGHQVDALSRSGRELPAGARHVAADLLSGAGFHALAASYDEVLWCAAPQQRSEAAYRDIYLDAPARLLCAVAVSRLWLVTSTAVYGEDQGQWVDEDTPPRPAAFNGEVLLEAERRHGANVAMVALRPAGLYGPGRTRLIERARAGTAPAPRWGNRIHLDDAAAACVHLMSLDAPQPLYALADDRPARDDQVLAWLRQRLGLEPVAAVPGPDSGKRVRNARLRSTGFAPRFPDFRAGYGALLES